MTTAALTLNEQALSLQTDLKTALEAFFEQLKASVRLCARCTTRQR